MTTPETLAAPLRTCVGCREKQSQRNMVRCVFGPDGPTVDRTAPGRGAWLCSEECLHIAIRRKAFERAWRRAVPAQELTALQNAFRTVITNVEELPTAGSTGGAPTKG